MGRHPSALDFAAAALLLVTAVASFVLVLCALCLARRRGDAARSWIVFYRAALAFFLPAIVLSFAKHLLAIVYRELHDVSIQANANAVLSGLLQAQVETNVIGALFHELALIFCLVSLAGLATGIAVADSGKPSSLDSIIRLASYAVGALLVILDVVGFALSEKFFAVVYARQDMNQEGLDAPESIWQALRANDVTLPMLIIQQIFAVALSARFTFVAFRTRSKQRLKTPIRYLGLCILLLVLKTSYDVAFYGQYHPPDRYQHADLTTSLPKPYFVIVNILVSIWPVFFVLVALLVLSVKKQRGLWAADPPLTLRTGPDMPLQTPWGYNYSPQSQQPLHPGSQQLHCPTGPTPPATYGHQHSPDDRYAQFRQGASSPPPPQWHAASSPPHQQQQYNMTGSLPSPPPPAHSEAMGLYHQADGMPPQVVPLPYDEKT
ncbi:hypothetical protein GQ602_001081 [Ophiocordyceps camponoti-floridani]|uniref:Uncharacterized protein n=1 Tax=Ophiocordyceps camponoti-floridani TaxID=2030778 RepID=A0A8H4VGW5_9HYPO|nr:hypothetical protein GQ602_001081 [Ophiocordyceps camponoti-floridani]